MVRVAQNEDAVIFQGVEVGVMMIMCGREKIIRQGPEEKPADGFEPTTC
jgi:hypothetical protein